MSLINCPECGNEVSDKATACPHCGNPINVEEKVIMNGLCNQCINSFVENGKAILTNKRFIYYKHKLSKMIAIGVLVNLTKGDYEFDIPLSEISSLSTGRQGISKTLIINTKSGKSYNFYVRKRKEWEESINKLLNSL